METTEIAVEYYISCIDSLGIYQLMLFTAVWLSCSLRDADGVSSQQTFAHATTTQLSCHEQNFVAIA